MAVGVVCGLWSFAHPKRYALFKQKDKPPSVPELLKSPGTYGGGYSS